MLAEVTPRLRWKVAEGGRLAFFARRWLTLPTGSNDCMVRQSWSSTSQSRWMTPQRKVPQ
eukprot:12351213-Prorocentrum_lima.AAC.1